MTNYEEQKLVLFGFVMGVLFSIIGFYMLKPNAQQITSKSNFEVVDTYKGCDVVRWDNGFAEYKYFLDCKKEGQTL